MPTLSRLLLASLALLTVVAATAEIPKYGSGGAQYDDLDELEAPEDDADAEADLDLGESSGPSDAQMDDLFELFKSGASPEEIAQALGIETEDWLAAMNSASTEDEALGGENVGTCSEAELEAGTCGADLESDGVDDEDGSNAAQAAFEAQNRYAEYHGEDGLSEDSDAAGSSDTEAESTETEEEEAEHSPFVEHPDLLSNPFDPEAFMPHDDGDDILNEDA